MKKSFLSRNVIFLSFISLCNDIASDMIYPLLPLFIVGVGGTAKILGVIEGVAATTASLLKLFGGYISDITKKRKPLTFIGYLLSNVLRPLYYFAQSWTPIFVVRFADRIGKGIRTAPRDALIADSTAPEDRAKAFSFHRALDNLGAVIGPLLAVGILSLFAGDIRMVFLFSVIPGIAVIVMFFFVKETAPEKKVEDAKDRTNFKEILSIKILPGELKLFILTVLIFTLGNSSDAFLILRLKEAGVDTVYIPLLWGALNLVKSLGNYPAGVVADRTSKKNVIIAGWLLYGIVYILFGLVTSKTAVVLIFLSYGLFYSLTEGVERAFIADMIPGELRGRAYGIYNFAIGISALPASLLFGFLWDKISYKAAFFTGASFSFIALAIFILSGSAKIESKPQRV